MKQAPFLDALAHDDQGATAVEYALIAGSIVVAIAGAVSGIGSKLAAMFLAVVAAFP